MINWILKLFPKVKQDWIRQASMDAFTKAHADIMETMRDDLDKQAEELAKKKLNDLLSNVDLTKIVTLDKVSRLVYIGGEQADAGRLKNLKAEAEAITQFELWGLIHETPKELAQRALFTEGTDIDAQGKKGRAILYTLSTQQNIIDMLKSFTEK